MASMQAPAPGTLLVATPALQESFFDGTVILLIESDQDGSLGVVLNHPSGHELPEALAQWRPQITGPAELFVGGPVSIDSALAVGLLREPTETPPGVSVFHGPLGLVDLDAPPELMSGAITRLRVFAGYSGWGAGQLEGEIDEGSWYVVPAERSDVFRSDTTGLRVDVLKRQPGQLAWHATKPADPELN